MPIMTGKQALMEMLRAEGVEYIFGNPGTTETPIMDELERHPDLKYMLVMQEGVAMGMADAYARATGKPSFVNLHIETGLANGMSLLHNANAGGTPLVLSAANLDIRELARGRTDLADLVRVQTKWSAAVTHPEQVPTVMRRAFNEAKTPPTGPTFVEFSANALDEEADVEIVPSSDSYGRIAPDGRAVDAATRLLATASRPIMVVGDRVGESRANAEAVEVAEMVGAAVYASSYGEMNFPTTHPQFKGSIKLGFPEAHASLSAADVVLMVGKLATAYYMFSAPSLEYFGADTKLVHVDPDANHVGSTHRTEVGLIADPKAALAELAEALESGMSGTAKEAAKGRGATLAAEKAEATEASRQRLKEVWDRSPISSYRMMHEVAKALPRDVVIVNDAVTSGAAVYDALDFEETGSIYGGRGGALGWGMGGAMGVKLAYPDRPVVAVDGDGSAMMTVQGLWTAANSNIPVVYVICNNRSYRVLKVNMDIYKDLILKEPGAASDYVGMDFPIPVDFAGVAEGMGVSGTRIEDPDEIAPALEHALGLGKPALLDVVVDGSL